MATPTLDRLAAEHDRRMAALDFLEWLGEQGIHLASWQRFTYTVQEGWPPNEREAERLTPNELHYIGEQRESLVMRWLGLDPSEIERERRALLDTLRVPAES